MNHKTCNVCNEEKPIEEFHKHPTRRDGRQPFCAKCYAQKYKGGANKDNKIFNVNEHKDWLC
jgi:hypothetical protein